MKKTLIAFLLILAACTGTPKIEKPQTAITPIQPRSVPIAQAPDWRAPSIAIDSAK